MIERFLNTLLLVSSVAVAWPGGVGAAHAAGSVTSDQQGLHQWPAFDGKLILVNGTYQDATTYKRSLTFYFESKSDKAWLHVPVVDSETERDLTWLSISQGEQTVADAAVVARAGGVELVIADTRPRIRAPVTVRRYRLTGADDDSYGPAYFFKKMSTTRYPASAGLTVEQVLQKEVAAQSKK